MAEIVWTEKASTHLQAIYKYIATDSPVYAARFVKSLINAANKLETMPFCGRIVPELDNQDLREVVFRNYRIVYSTSELPVLTILAVVHGARDFTPTFSAEWDLTISVVK